MMSPEIQELLEDIFERYGNLQEAQKNPERCLEALLVVIDKKASRGGHGSVHSTLMSACEHPDFHVERHREAKGQAKS